MANQNIKSTYRAKTTTLQGTAVKLGMQQSLLLNSVSRLFYVRAALSLPNLFARPKLVCQLAFGILTFNYH